MPPSLPLMALVVAETLSLWRNTGELLERQGVTINLVDANQAK